MDRRRRQRRHVPIGSGAADGRGYLFYDNVAQNTSTSNTLSNSPVVNATTDGVHYGGCLDAEATVCKAPAAVISTEDDIVGNAFVDDNPTSPRYHAVDEVRGSSDSNKVLFSTCRGAKTGETTAAKTAAACANPTKVMAGDPGLVNTNWSDHTVAALPPATSPSPSTSVRSTQLATSTSRGRSTSSTPRAPTSALGRS